MMKIRRYLGSSRGNSLVSIIIAIGLVGMVAAGVVLWVQTYAPKVAEWNKAYDLVELRQKVWISFHSEYCIYGSLPGNCAAAGTIFPLKRPDGRLVFPLVNGNIHAATEQFHIRAVCRGLGKYQVMYKKKNAAIWEPLFPIPNTCPVEP